MRPVHLSRLRVRDGDLRDLANLHAEWVLGLGRFADLREGRLSAGVPDDVSVDQLAGVRLRLGLQEAGGRKRTSVIRLVPEDAAVRVEHLVVREGPPSALRARAEPPEVVAMLLERFAVDQGPDPVDGHAHRITERDVPSLVDRILAVDRTVPLVLVSVDNATRDPLLDPAELAKCLAGMADVRFLATVSTSRELKHALLARGFSDKYGCYNGGIRILWPGIRPEDDPYDHLLLLPTRLLGVPGHARAAHFAGVFCEMIGEDEDLRAWIREVDAPAKPSRPRPAPPPLATSAWQRGLSEVAPQLTGMGERPPAMTAPSDQSPPDVPLSIASRATATEDDRVGPPPPERSEPADDGEPREASLTDTAMATPSAPEDEGERATSVSAAPRQESDWIRVAQEVTAALELAAEQESDLDALRRELVASKKALRRAEQERDEAAGSLGAPQSVAAALHRAEALFGNRLVVLPSARGSAEDSRYRDPGRALFVLTLLAHCDAGGIGDVLQKALGGMARWKPKDSPETIAAFGRDRTWTDSMRALKLFKRHITLGHGVDPGKCMQIYYDVAADGRVEIAWCGEHRRTVSADT
jgi:hypothetical protein